MCNKIYVTGPVRSLPGALFSPEGNSCDEHENVPAVHRIQGETDSFGAEYFYVCQQCFDEYKKQLADNKNEETFCDWCKASTIVGDTFKMRDYDEGSCGPLYIVCRACKERYLAQVRKEQENFWDSEDDESEFYSNDL